MCFFGSISVVANKSVISNFFYLFQNKLNKKIDLQKILLDYNFE